MACTAARISYLSSYFDSLVDLVPVKNYLDPDEVLDLRSMKRHERQQTKQAFKAQHKLAKRAKLDPDGEAHTTAAQRRQDAEEERFRPNLGLLLQNKGNDGPAGARQRTKERAQTFATRLKRSCGCLAGSQGRCFQ